MAINGDGFTHGRVGLRSGGIHYRERGTGQPIVFVHGFLANGRLWDRTASLLAAGNRCILPDWPLGSHSEALSDGAERTPRGVARMISEFLADLDLDDVTIVGNDSGGAISQILVTEMPGRIGRLVLTNCDCFENFPPDRFKVMATLTRPRFAYSLLAHSLRLPAIRRSPFAYGSLMSGPAEDELLRSFTEPQLHDAGVRRDAWEFFGSADVRDTLGAAKLMPELRIPVLLAWGTADRLFPVGDAQRLAELIPDARVVEIPGAAGFVMLEKPRELAAAIESFLPDQRSRS